MSKAAELAKAGETLTNQPSGRKNIVTNGAMQVAQRATSATGKTSAGYYAVDRNYSTIEDSGTWTITQTADGPSGFANCLRYDCTTADAAVAAAARMMASFRLEGQDLQQLKKGTSDAEYFTISFWVKSNKTGNYVLGIYDHDTTDGRQVAKLYTINSADTWEYKSITYPPDTSGPLNDDNGLSLQLQFYLAAGTNWTSGTRQEAWAAVTAANRAAGQAVQLSDNTANDWSITGVQMEIGSQATPFEHRSFGEELLLCQRYFFIGCSSTDAHTGGMANGSFRTTSNAQVLQQHPVAMRTNPTTALRASGSVVIHDTNDGNNINVTAIDAVVMQSIKSTIFGLTLASASGVVGEGCWAYSAGGTPGITFDAEL